MRFNSFLTRNTVKTGDQEDFVVRANLLSGFHRGNRDRQQDRKAKMTKDNFLKRMKTFFGFKNHKAKHRQRWDAFLGFKIRDLATEDVDDV